MDMEFCNDRFFSGSTHAQDGVLSWKAYVIKWHWAEYSNRSKPRRGGRNRDAARHGCFCVHTPHEDNLYGYSREYTIS